MEIEQHVLKVMVGVVIAQMYMRAHVRHAWRRTSFAEKNERWRKSAELLVTSSGKRRYIERGEFLGDVQP